MKMEVFHFAIAFMDSKNEKTAATKMKIQLFMDFEMWAVNQ